MVKHVNLTRLHWGKKMENTQLNAKKSFYVNSPLMLHIMERSKTNQGHHLERVYDLNTEFTGNSSTFGCFQNACHSLSAFPSEFLNLLTLSELLHSAVNPTIPCCCSVPIVRLAPYLFFDRNENEALRNRNAVFSVNCTVFSADEMSFREIL